MHYVFVIENQRLKVASAEAGDINYLLANYRVIFQGTLNECNEYLDDVGYDPNWNRLSSNDSISTNTADTLPF